MCENQQHVCWKQVTACLERYFRVAHVGWWHLLILMWICSCERGGGSPLSQVRQEVDSKVRGPKVQEGKVPAPLSSSVKSCLLMGGGG